MTLQHAIEVDHAGMTIRGMVYRPDVAGRVPTVLLLHGFTGQRIEAGFLFVRISRALAQAGIAAVTFDFRHSGESDGNFQEMLVSGELADVLRMTDWLLGQPFVLRSHVGLLGCSLGGLLAACTVGRTDAYRALCLLAPSTVANLCRVAKLGAPIAGRLVIGPHLLAKDFISDAQSLDPLSDVVKHPRPTLLVQGTGDQAVAPAVSQQYVDAMRQANVPCTQELLEGADHVFSKPHWQKQTIDLAAGFFQKQLAAALSRP